MDHHDHSSLKSSKCIPKDFKKRVEELCELRLKPRAIMQKLEAQGWDHLDHKKYLQVFLLQFRSISFKITSFLFNFAAATQVCGIKKGTHALAGTHAATLRFFCLYHCSLWGRRGRGRGRNPCYGSIRSGIGPR